METVLGLSLTATHVQTTLMDARSAYGVTLDHIRLDAFSAGIPAAQASEQVAQSVLRMERAGNGRLRTIAVTWSGPVDLEAALVLNSLLDVGFRNVVAVQLPHAAEAFARGLGRVKGHRRTAVCVVEPDTIVLSLVDISDGETKTLVSPAMDTAALLAWAGSIFDDGDWTAERLFVVGAVSGLDVVATLMQQRLGLPVTVPPEAELALARGAALASTDGPGIEPMTYPAAPARRGSIAGPATMLAAGAVSLVTALALAAGPHLLPARDSLAVATTHSELQSPAPDRRSAEMSAVPGQPDGAVPPAAVPSPAAEQRAQELLPPSARVDEARTIIAPTFRTVAPTPQEQPQAAYQPSQVPYQPPTMPYRRPPEQVPVEAPPVPPPVVTAPIVIPRTPVQQPRLRDRILGKIPGLRRLSPGY